MFTENDIGRENLPVFSASAPERPSPAPGCAVPPIWIAARCV